MSQPAKIINFPPRHLAQGQTSAPPDDFTSKFHARAAAHSPFCLGLDPADEILGTSTLADYCAKFAEQVITEGVALVKPQSAYFERFGAQGLAVLEKLTQTLRQEGILVLLDVKRGDIDATNRAYAQAYFSSASPLCADAITASPYLGFEDLAPFFQQDKAYVFVVAASSNGAALRHQQGGVLRTLLDKIAAEPKAGAVIGATREDLTAEVLAPLADSLLLCPGLGAQGGSFDIFEKFPAPQNIIPTASRSILKAENFTDALKAYKERAAKLFS